MSSTTFVRVDTDDDGTTTVTDATANLTSSSDATTVRIAILNQREALDELLTQLDGA